MCGAACVMRRSRIFRIFLPTEPALCLKPRQIVPLAPLSGALRCFDTANQFLEGGGHPVFVNLVKSG